MPEFKNFNKPDLRTGIKFFLSRVKVSCCVELLRKHFYVYKWDNYGLYAIPQIGDFNFSSFQLESSNLKDAQEYVAKLALNELHRRLDSVDSAVLPHTNNETIIIDRVAEVNFIVSDLPYSRVFFLANQVEALWFQNYNVEHFEQAPGEEGAKGADCLKLGPQRSKV